MKISVRNLFFSYHGKAVFHSFDADFGGEGNYLPVAVMGASGCGKTTLLKILGGLLKPQSGEIIFSGDSGKGEVPAAISLMKGEVFLSRTKAAFMFQEPRLLPWLNVLDNVSLPLEKLFGKKEARLRARYFLSLVSLNAKENVNPRELSGGEAQRVSLARAFAWPAPLLLMDEPFQSLDIPLRVKLMDMALSLLEKDKRLLLAVTHDPREAVYLGGRVVVLEKSGKGIVYDKPVNIQPGNKSYVSAGTMEMEREIIDVLENEINILP